MKYLLIALFLVSICRAQDAPIITPDQVVNPAHTVDCSQFENTQSCKSYNEMVNANDKDILRMFEGTTLACFSDNADSFVTLSFSEPLGASYKKVGPGLWKARGRVTYNRFAYGVSDRFYIATGNWIKTSSDDSRSFVSLAPAKTKSFVDDTEITFGYQFINLIGSTTSYNITVRRSTLRFVEETFAPDDKKKNETINGRDDGHCAQVSTNSY